MLALADLGVADPGVRSPRLRRQGPRRSVFIDGSSFAQGDQPSQAWKSFTSPNTTSGGAAIRVLRSMRYVAGRVAMMITSTSNHGDERR